jgi:rsbT co-antagonist protein RsbR
MADKSYVTVPFERIQRVIDILSMVSIGEYNAEQIQIPTHQESDEFSVLEAALNIYNQELSTARSQNERYIAELEASKSALQDQLTTIARQQMAIHELSTPIVEVWEDILLLPIIGSLDSQRALEMTEKLLDRIKQSRSRCIIIDITGLEVVDTTTANAVLKMTRASRLLGASCVLTGIRPDIARTMIQLGVDLQGLRTLRTLKDGIRECFLSLRKSQAQKAKKQKSQAATSANTDGASSNSQGSASSDSQSSSDGSAGSGSSRSGAASSDRHSSATLATFDEPVPLSAVVNSLTEAGGGSR